MREAFRLATWVVLVCAAYYAGAIFGITFKLPRAGIGGISTIWPPNAIVLAALLLAPPRVWWVYLLALLPTHLHVVATFQGAVPLAVMFSQFSGNMLQAVLGAAAVRAVVGAPPRLDSLRGMASFVLLAAVLVPALLPSWRLHLFLLTGWATDFWLSWRQRFFANGARSPCHHADDPPGSLWRTGRRATGTATLCGACPRDPRAVRRGLAGPAAGRPEPGHHARIIAGTVAVPAVGGGSSWTWRRLYVPRRRDGHVVDDRVHRALAFQDPVTDRDRAVAACVPARDIRCR